LIKNVKCIAKIIDFCQASSITRNEAMEQELKHSIIAKLRNKKKRTYHCKKAQNQECMKYEAPNVVSSLKQSPRLT
jgi:hypothetical protein